MVITLTPEIEAGLNDLANRQGVAPDVLVLEILRDRLRALNKEYEPRDE
jgi:hypothetical protein